MTANRNANPFAKFTSKSPISSIDHDYELTLASNCVRDYFGPTVQIVADALMLRSSGLTLGQIITLIETKGYRKVHRSGERLGIMRTSNLRVSSRSSKNGNGAPNHANVRASLLSLVQHSIVNVEKKTSFAQTKSSKGGKSGNKKKVLYTYTIDVDRARLLTRYPRLVEYTKKASGTIASKLIETLLVQGKARTVQAIFLTVEQLQQEETDTNDHKYTNRQSVLEAFLRLTRAGFIEQVAEIKEEKKEDESGVETSVLEIKIKSEGNEKDDDDGGGGGEDPAIVDLLAKGPYKSINSKAVWRVNLPMFLEQLRAVSLGWLVAERYNSKIQSSGSLVTAALKFAAAQRYSPVVANAANGNRSNFERIHNFTVKNILRYLPKTIVQNFEKKEGGLAFNIHKALYELSELRDPAVVEQVEVAPGNEADSKFQIQTPRLVGYLHDRIIHQVIFDHHGEVAARICHILRNNGYMEADKIAKMAMTTDKDCRELLHQLYCDNYIELFNINQNKQHNPKNMIYLWKFDRQEAPRRVGDKVCKALHNIRLRRQHEAEVGKDFIERAKEAEATEENEHAEDKLMFQKFCQGLERLDNAALQLDETLMVLKDY